MAPVSLSLAWMAAMGFSWLGLSVAAKAATPAVKGVNGFFKKHLPDLHRAAADAMKRVGEPIAERLQAPVRRKKLMRDFNDAATNRRVTEIKAAQLAKLERWDKRQAKRKAHAIEAGQRSGVAPAKGVPGEFARPKASMRLSQTVSPKAASSGVHEHVSDAEQKRAMRDAIRGDGAGSDHGDRVARQQDAAAGIRESPGGQQKTQGADYDINNQDGGWYMNSTKPPLSQRFEAATKSNTDRVLKPENAPPRKEMAPRGVVVPAPGGSRRAPAPLGPPQHEVPSLTPAKSAQQPKMDPEQLRNHFNPKALKP